MVEQACPSLEPKVDLTACDREPIHIPGAIQGHGALIALAEPEMTITQVSANIGELIGTKPLDAIGKELAEHIGLSAAGEVTAALRRDPLSSANPVPLIIRERTFDGILHRNHGATILELEPSASPAHPKDVLLPVLMRLQSAVSVSELFAIAVAEIRMLTGFDRVMLYRFHRDGHGEVVEEAQAPDVESYRGHHYPASDIPAQARRLYLLDWIRVIPDIAYGPVPLVPVTSPRTGQPLDLSLATLRSVSPVHLEYLRNMGVRASMSVSLVRDGELWGLFACHHREPRRLPFVLRAACELVGRLVSLQASALAELEWGRERSGFRDAEAELIEAMRSDTGGWAAGLKSRSGPLLRVMKATGAAICGARGILRIGETPTVDEITALLAWISPGESGVFETNALAQAYAPAREYAAVASGLLAITIAEPSPSPVLFFRGELLTTVTWAGDPSKPVSYYGDRIHPRRSFVAWVQEVRGVSAPWTRLEVEIAEDLRRHIVEIELDRARREEARLRVELEQVTHAVATVSEAIANLPRPDVPAVLTTLALQAQTLTGAEYAAVGIVTDRERPFDPWIAVGIPPETVRALGRFPRPIGVLGEVAFERRAVRVPDVRRHPTFQSLPPGHPDITSFLGVPLARGGQLLGILYLANKTGAAEFSAEDERKVQMLAARVFAAVQTARLYAREAERQTWLNTTVDQMPEAVIVLDRAGRIAALNRAAMALSWAGATGVDPFGNSIIFNLRSPDGSQLPFEEYPVVRALQRGEVTKAQELLVHVGGGPLVPVLSNAAPVHDERGELIGATNLVQDISAIKEFERLREEWGSAVAHDLRQPVGTIAIAVQLLRKRLGADLREDDRHSLERIERSTARLSRMIEDLLHASLIEAKRLPLKCRLVDLPSLIDAVVEDQRAVLTSHRVDVVAERNQLAWVDPDRIDQVLDNLISNAAKYGAPGTPIRVESVVHEHLIEVTVTNHGAGIPAHELPKLFSRFERAVRAHIDRIPGLGLGLYISKGLVEAHGGRIWAESVPGGETSFHFTVPRAPPEAPSIDGEQAPRSP